MFHAPDFHRRDEHGAPQAQHVLNLLCAFLLIRNCERVHDGILEVGVRVEFEGFALYLDYAMRAVIPGGNVNVVLVMGLCGRLRHRRIHTNVAPRSFGGQAGINPAELEVLGGARRAGDNDVWFSSVDISKIELVGRKIGVGNDPIRVVEVRQAPFVGGR